MTPVGDSPCARVGHSCSYLPPVGDAERGKVFIVGGADPNRSFSDVHTIDLGKTNSCGEFPGGPMAGTLHLHCSLIPGRGIGILHATRRGQKKKRPAAAEHTPYMAREQGFVLPAMTIPKTISSDQTAGFSSEKMNITERSLRSQQTPGIYPPNQDLLDLGERVHMEPWITSHSFINYFSGRH